MVGSGTIPDDVFLSTPSARRATSCFLWTRQCAGISIHALREEGDLCRTCRVIVRDLFLSTPSARRATQRPPCRMPHRLFLSTPSARRATQSGCCRHLPAQNFYPRPPRGGRLQYPIQPLHPIFDFYPRPPRGGRRRASCCTRPPQGISIHALREEGDPCP